MSRTKRKPQLSREPTDVNKTVWFYDNNKSLEFIVECRPTPDDFHRTIRFRVPSRKLIAALKRQGLISEKSA